MRLIAKLTLSCIFWALSFNAIAMLPAKSGYIQVDGGKLYYEKYGIPSAEAMIVLHGGPGLDSSYLLPQMAELAKNNEVIFYDQRGSGKSLGFVINEQTITMDVFMLDLEAVRKKLRYKKFILVAHSWGGVLAMNYALQYSDHLSGIVLISSAPSNAQGFKEFLDVYAKRLEPMQNELQKIANSNEFQKGDPIVMEDFLRKIFSVYFYKAKDLEKLNLKFTREYALNFLKIGSIFETNYLASYDLQPELKNLKMPVVIIHGRNDIVPLSTAQKTQASIPNSKLIVIEECDHFPYIEKPKEFFSIFQKPMS